MPAVRRGEIWWADLRRRAVRNRASGVWLLLVNIPLANAPGNVLFPRRVSGLRAESVINVSQLVALDRRFLTDHVGKIPPGIQAYVDAGLRLVLDLGSAIS